MTGVYCDKILPDDIVTRGLSSAPRSDIERIPAPTKTPTIPS